VETIINRVRQLCPWARWPIKLKAGLADERGAAAVFFAVGLVLLAPAALGLVDVYLTTTQRAELQDALDTATLYAARSEEIDNTKLTEIGRKALLANLKLPDEQKLLDWSFTLDGITITGTATVTPPGIGPELWPRTPLQASSEVLRNSNNVEVAMVLDVTGSMSGEMSNLKTAAKDLVDLVIKDQQQPYYTKIALVPYSVGVNLGGYAAAARGPLVGPTAITGASKTNPVVVTSPKHGLKTDDRVRIRGVSGMPINNDYVVRYVDEDKFSLRNVDGREFNKYQSGGNAYCTREGCEYFNFANADNGRTTLAASACATERPSDYTDASPTTAFVGRHYGASCPEQPIIPLSTDRTALKAAITNLDPKGSTAGQIGLAWGWYMISPEWSGLWADASDPAPYDTRQLLKVVILMTDGAFNSPYCQGVVASDAGSGAPSGGSRINCPATNGDPFTQAEKLCANIKAKKVIVYTVGFNVSNDTRVKNLMKNCATSPEYAYMPSGGQQLKVAFRAIAQDINSLRISK
jgi:Flp pilus assembly protein TadG